LTAPAAQARWPVIRFGRLLPRLWLALTLLALVGGILYTPNNYDYLSYRFPRVLNWCWEQKWFWIETTNQRMNYSASLFEWIMVPFFILFQTDRLFFLINFVSYLFFPGLVFSVFRGLGISGRISWWWMWVLPCGYCYILQSTGLGNDSIAAVYLLAALHFLFRFRATGAGRNLVLSTLAAALMTGAKASNLPLLLPWVILLFFTRDRVFRGLRPVVTAIVLLAATGVSFVPLAVLNRIHTGDFFGDPTNEGKMKVSNPVLGIIGNCYEIGTENLALPLWYREQDWNFLAPPAVQSMLSHDFPRLHLSLLEFPTEDVAGVGLGCVLGAALFLAVSAWARRSNRALIVERSGPATWIVAGGAMALLVYMGKIASEAAPRLVAPYYVLIIAGVMVLAALDGRVMRWRLFQFAGLAVVLSALPMLILAPARPLFPMQTVAALLANHGGAKLRQRLDDVYGLFATRAFAFQQVLPLIPATENSIGLVQNGNALEAALWRPFGSHRVVDVQAGAPVEAIKARGVRWLVVSGDALTNRGHTDIATVLAQWSAHVVAEKHFAMTVHQGDDVWYVVSLDGN
jgi:hypothetical protein